MTQRSLPPGTRHPLAHYFLTRYALISQITSGADGGSGPLGPAMPLTDTKQNNLV